MTRMAGLQPRNFLWRVEGKIARVQLDRPEEALTYFQRALAVNPNLQNVENMIQQLKQVVIEKRRGTI